MGTFFCLRGRAEWKVDCGLVSLSISKNVTGRRVFGVPQDNKDEDNKDTVTMKRWKVRSFAFAGIVALLGLWYGCQTTAMTSAKVYINQNDWTLARDQLLVAVAETPENSEAQMLLGIAEAKAGNLTEAAAAFDAAEADELRAEEANRWRRKFWVETFNVGLAALNDDSLDEAESSFTKATVLDPKGAMAYRNLGIVHERQERNPEAAAAYEMAVSIDPTDTSTALQLGYLHYEDEKWEKAVEWIAPRVASTQDAGYYRVLASAYDHLEMEDEALAALQAALKIEPEESELLSEIAGIFLRRDDDQTAVSYLERASALAPDDTVVGYNYAVSLIRIQDETTALNILEGLVAGDDNFADGWELLSRLYLRADRIKEGQEAYDKAEKLRAAH